MTKRPRRGNRQKKTERFATLRKRRAQQSALYAALEHKRRDEGRRRNLVLAGWRPLVYTWMDVARAPDRLVREYLTAAATAR